LPIFAAIASISAFRANILLFELFYLIGKIERHKEPQRPGDDWRRFLSDRERAGD